MNHAKIVFVIAMNLNLQTCFILFFLINFLNVLTTSTINTRDITFVKKWYVQKNVILIKNVILTTIIWFIYLSLEESLCYIKYKKF